MRPFMFVLGWILFVIGFVGVFVPVLPTTPFMLLALWCFSQSSQRFHDWLYGHRVFGPPLQQWHRHRVIPWPAKAVAAAFMVASLVYLFGYATMPAWAKALMAAVIAVGLAFILTRSSIPPRE